MKRTSVRLLICVAIGLQTTGCATTSTIDLYAPDVEARLAELNDRASPGKARTRMPATEYPMCIPDTYVVRRFRVDTDSTLLDLGGGNTVSVPTPCLLSITLTRRGRGAAFGFLAGAAAGSVGGLGLTALVAFVTLVGGETLPAGEAVAIVGLSAGVTGAFGAAMGWIRGAPARYRVNPSATPRH